MRGRPHSPNGPRRSFFQEVARTAARIVRDFAKHFIALLLVEAPRLKPVGIEPQTDAAAFTRDLFGLGENFRADVLAAKLFGHDEQLDETPVERGLAPDAADRLAGRRIVDQDRERLVIVGADGLGIVGQQRICDHQPFGLAGRIRHGDDRRVGHASPAVSNIAADIASAAVLPAHTTNCNAG